MGFNWGNAIGGAASGAGAGLAGGPLGVIAGGLAGLIGGGISSTDKPQYDDKYTSMLAPQISSELQSNVGAQEATATAGALRANANNAYRGIANNPNFSGNASVLSSAYNQAQTSAQHGIVSADIGGAQLDQQTHQEGIRDAMSASRNDLAAFQTNSGISMSPSPLSQIGMNFLGSAAGQLAGTLGGGGSSSSASEADQHLRSMNYTPASW